MNTNVAPFTGAWIEIRIDVKYVRTTIVAPFTGAWIEIKIELEELAKSTVAPFTGAWIEMFYSLISKLDYRSLPSRGRGLK